MGIAVIYGLVLFRLTLPKRSHLIEYGVVAVFVFEAIQERVTQGRRVPAPAFLAIVVTSMIGATDEFIQFLLPNREFEWTDIVFNVLAAVMATVAMVVLRWARRLADRRRTARLIGKLSAASDETMARDRRE